MTFLLKHKYFNIALLVEQVARFYGDEKMIEPPVRFAKIFDHDIVDLVSTEQFQNYLEISHYNFCSLYLPIVRNAFAEVKQDIRQKEFQVKHEMLHLTSITGRIGKRKVSIELCNQQITATRFEVTSVDDGSIISSGNVFQEFAKLSDIPDYDSSAPEMEAYRLRSDTEILKLFKLAIVNLSELDKIKARRIQLKTKH